MAQPVELTLRLAVVETLTVSVALELRDIVPEADCEGLLVTLTLGVAERLPLLLVETVEQCVGLIDKEVVGLSDIDTVEQADCEELEEIDAVAHVLEVTLAQALELGLRVKVGEVVLDKEPLAVVLAHGEEEPQCERVGVGLPLLLPLTVGLPVPVTLLELEVDEVKQRVGEVESEADTVPEVHGDGLLDEHALSVLVEL